MKSAINEELNAGSKKEAIMLAAMELFIENGYRNTRIIDIAEKAGIGKGTVYAYFDSKEEILTQVAKDFVRRDYEQYAGEFLDFSDLRQNMINYIEIAEKMINKYGIYAMMFRDQILFDPNVKSDEIVKVIMEINNDQYKKMALIIEKGIEDGFIAEANRELATMFAMSAVAGYGISKVMKISDKDSFCPLPQWAFFGRITKEKLVDFILYGICGKGDCADEQDV